MCCALHLNVTAKALHHPLNERAIHAAAGVTYDCDRFYRYPYFSGDFTEHHHVKMPVLCDMFPALARCRRPHCRSSTCHTCPQDQRKPENKEFNYRPRLMNILSAAHVSVIYNMNNQINFNKRSGFPLKKNYRC